MVRQSSMQAWTSLLILQRVFVICDSDIEKGNVEIETGSGKLIVGIDGVLEKIRSELL